MALLYRLHIKQFPYAEEAEYEQQFQRGLRKQEGVRVLELVLGTLVLHKALLVLGG